MFMWVNIFRHVSCKPEEMCNILDGALSIFMMIVAAAGHHHSDTTRSIRPPFRGSLWRLLGMEAGRKVNCIDKRGGNQEAAALAIIACSNPRGNSSSAYDLRCDEQRLLISSH
jgi:hypothetical protein